MPFGGKIQNGVFELVALMAVFPLLLLASAGTPVANGKAAAACAFFAELSYPFYMSHYPFMKMCGRIPSTIRPVSASRWACASTSRSPRSPGW